MHNHLIVITPGGPWFSGENAGEGLAMVAVIQRVYFKF